LRVQVYSSDLRDSVDVELEGVAPEEYQHISDVLIEGLERNEPAYNAVAQAMLTATQLCPQANPADLWVHAVYREYRLRAERSDQSWKRVSGQAFEYVLLSSYAPRLAQRDIVFRRATSGDAIALGLHERGIGSSKTDLVLEGIASDRRERFGVIHCKASIAERLSDDAPASQALIEQGYWSAVATMDAKMYPPPHGDAVVRGELKHTRGGDKRRYFEVAGQFSGCYSFNSRTPPSQDEPLPKSRIYSLTFTEEQPDVLVRDIVEYWREFQRKIA